jgi:hypothetical protein
MISNDRDDRDRVDADRRTIAGLTLRDGRARLRVLGPVVYRANSARGRSR